MKKHNIAKREQGKMAYIKTETSQQGANKNEQALGFIAKTGRCAQLPKINPISKR